MRRTHLRGIVLLLIVSILLQTGVLAAERRDTIAGLEIPDNWAHDALAFAVEEGILSGKGDKGLCPKDNATRAEMTAMIVRVIGAKPKNDTMPFVDCNKNSWYYEPMSAAYEMGIIYGTSDLTLSPKNNTTREQAFTILARAFRISGGDPAVLKDFSDGNTVGSYAVDAMAAMIQAGYVHGAKGKLNPKNNITRQELAQVLYEMFDDICRGEDATRDEYQNLLYAGTTPFPEGTVIHGDLIIPCDAQGTIDLNGVTVEGRLIVLGDCTVSGGVISVADILSSCTLTGTIGILELITDGICVTLDGSAVQTTISARHAVLQGAGSAGNVTIFGVGSTANCAADASEEKIDAGLDGVTITQTIFPTASCKQPTVKVTARFDHVDNEHLYGVDGNHRVCSVKWYLNGEKVAENSKFALTEGATQSATITIPFTRQMPDSYPISVRLTYGAETKSIPIEVKIDKTNLDAYLSAAEIPTINVLATIRYDYTAMDGTQLKRGDVVYFRGYNCLQIPSTGKTVIRVPDSVFQIVDKTYYNNSIAYSQAVAEAFVNDVNHYSSKTDYLIWCNLYTQHIFIFKGSKGNWKLVKADICSTGVNGTPTRPGVHYINQKTEKNDDGGFYENYFTQFDGDIGFHTRLKSYGGGYYDSRIGYPISHGCVRLYDDTAKLIFVDCDMGTTVVVW